MSRRAKLSARILFSAAAIFYLFHVKVDIRFVANEISGLILPYFLAAAILHFTGLIFSSIRWYYLLLAQDMRIPILRLFHFYLVGTFFNTFLPGRVGGDLMRIYDSAREKNRTIEPLTVVLVERGSGTITLLGLAALVILLRIDIGFDISRFLSPFWFSMFFFSGLLLLLLAFLHPWIAESFLRLFRIPLLVKFEPKIRRMYEALRVYRYRPGCLSVALLAGLALQINYILHYFLIGKALGLQVVPFAAWFVFIPVRAILLMTPFFINGIGLRELIDQAFYGFYGIDTATAVSFSWLTLSLQFLFGAVGGVVYALRRK